MEDRECEQKAIDVFSEETVLETAAVKLAADIIQESYSRRRREVLEELLYESESVMLLLSRRRHVHQPDNAIVSAGTR